MLASRAVQRKRALAPALRQWAAFSFAHRAKLNCIDTLSVGAELIRVRHHAHRALAVWKARLFLSERAGSLELRTVIRSLEQALLDWRVWAAAQRKWHQWATYLVKRTRPWHRSSNRASIDQVVRPKHREWADGAAIRWDIASMGFAGELRDEARRALREYREQDGARRMHGGDLGIRTCGAGSANVIDFAIT